MTQVVQMVWKYRWNKWGRMWRFKLKMSLTITCTTWHYIPPLCRLCSPFLHRMVISINKRKTHDDIASRMKCIMKWSARIRFDLCFRLIENRRGIYDPQKASVFLEEVEVAGIESDIDKLIGWLAYKSPRRSVVSVAIIGMGGAGQDHSKPNLFMIVG